MTDGTAAYESLSEPARSAPHGSENRARGRVVPVRVDDDEHARWSAFAASKGKSLAGMLRLSIEAVMADETMREAHRG